jgi:DNA-binding winged helix-turn-helix (wHTH) protein
MALTAFADRHAPSAPVGSDRPTHPRRAPAGRPIIVVTMQVTLDGDTPDPVAALRELAERVVAIGDLTVVSPVRLAEAPQSAADSTVKPAVELVAEIHPAQPSPAVTPAADAVRIDVLARSVTKGNESIALCRREFDLLLFLAEHRGQVFNRRQLLSAVWGDPFTGERTIDVHITRLRRKLNTRQHMITTVRGIGYRLADGAPIAVVDGGRPHQVPEVPWTPRPVGSRAAEYAVSGAA